MDTPTHRLMRRVRRRRENGERGAALLELAVALPIFVVILALIFDYGIGFSAARDSSSAARSAARVAALAGDERLADYRALNAVRGEYTGTDDSVVWVSIYRSPAFSADNGAVPAGCGKDEGGVAGLCNTYDGSVLETLATSQFVDDDCIGEMDALWCPTTRSDDDGDYLGVAVWTTHDPTVGLIVPDSGEWELSDRAVFALYFPADTFAD